MDLDNVDVKFDSLWNDELINTWNIEVKNKENLKLEEIKKILGDSFYLS